MLAGEAVARLNDVIPWRLSTCHMIWASVICCAPARCLDYGVNKVYYITQVKGYNKDCSQEKFPKNSLVLVWIWVWWTSAKFQWTSTLFELPTWQAQRGSVDSRISWTGSHFTYDNSRSQLLPKFTASVRLSLSGSCPIRYFVMSSFISCRSSSSRRSFY